MKKAVSLFSVLSMAALCSCSSAAAEVPVLDISGELVKSQINAVDILTYAVSEDELLEYYKKLLLVT